MGRVHAYMTLKTLFRSNTLTQEVGGAWGTEWEQWKGLANCYTFFTGFERPYPMCHDVATASSRMVWSDVTGGHFVNCFEVFQGLDGIKLLCKTLMMREEGLKVSKEDEGPFSEMINNMVRKKEKLFSSNGQTRGQRKMHDFLFLLSFVGTFYIVVGTSKDSISHNSMCYP